MQVSISELKKGHAGKAGDVIGDPLLPPLIHMSYR